MSNKLFIEFDNDLKKSEIRIPIRYNQKEDIESGSGGNKTNIDPTKVYGIVSPLIMINSTVIDFNNIISFELKSIGVLPTLSMTVSDSNRLISNIDKPGIDNEVRVEILPPFDNVYKKINLTFFISSISVNDNIINLQCTYKVPKLYESCLKSFGYISTYELFRNVAIDTKLGFMTNIINNDDKRYIYSPNMTYLDLLENEISRSDSHLHVFDYWIDVFDNLNFVDIKERYNSVDNDDDMKIYISSQRYDVGLDINDLNSNKPVLMPAVISNHPGFNSNELYVKDYKIKVNSGQNVLNGTDVVYTTFNDMVNEHADYFIQNGDVKRDKFFKLSYLGEVFGDYNYLLAKPIREAFIKKINSEVITVTLPAPSLGLIRGGKVNFIRYVNDDIIKGKIKSLEDTEVNGVKLVDKANATSNITLDDYELNDSEESDNYKLDRNISGQYLIIGVELKYSGLTSKRGWEYKLNLVKPKSNSIINLAIEDNIENQNQ